MAAPPKPKPSAPLPQLGKYQLIRKLGQGGMGTVYLAKDRDMQRDVALKILLDEHASDPRLLARFRREIRALGNLSHPNIVRAFTVGEHEGQQFVAMEYCQGESLETMLERRGRLPAEEALRIGLQVARGLEHAHQHGLVHRDIKPANILLCKDGTAKILDLGLSKMLAEAESSFLTQTGTVLGTLHYISPEQASGEGQVDLRSDIFSLGATLFHLTTGRPPHLAKNGAVLLSKHISEDAPRARSVCTDVPEPASRLIGTMLEREVRLRYQTCGEVASEIERILAGRPLRGAAGVLVRTQVLPAAADPAPPPRSKPVILWASCALVTLVLLMTIVCLKVRQSETSLSNAGAASLPATPALPALPPPPPVPAMPASAINTSPPLIADPLDVPTTPATPSAPKEAQWVFLSELSESSIKTIEPTDRNNPAARWQSAHLGFNKGVWGTAGRMEIMVGREASPHGLAMHPPRSNDTAEVRYKLDGAYLRFQAQAAIDDQTYNRGQRKTQTPLSFIVRGDGKQLWKSDPLQQAGQSQACDVDVTGVAELELIVDCPGDSFWAMGVWVEPRVLRAAGVAAEKRIP